MYGKVRHAARRRSASATLDCSAPLASKEHRGADPLQGCAQRVWRRSARRRVTAGGELRRERRRRVRRAADSCYGPSRLRLVVEAAGAHAAA
jgi:hypothetical protein